MKRIIALCLILVSLPLCAQVERREVRSGNRKFTKDKYKQAEIDYRRAIVKDSTSVAAQYDLASALYRQQDYEGASKALGAVKEQVAVHPSAASWHYNSGDVALQKKDYAAAVEAFRQSLLLDPGDMDAKENYIYAKKMLENQQQNGGGSDNDQDQDQNQNQNQDQDNQDPQQNQDQQQQQQQQQSEGGISPQQAQQILKAVQAQEQKTQDKVKKEKAEMLQSRQKEKNW